jgi:hypothetical protein
VIRFLETDRGRGGGGLRETNKRVAPREILVSIADEKKKKIFYVCIDANFFGGAIEDDAIVCGLLTHPSCGFSFMFGDSFSPSTAVTVWSNESSPVYLWGSSDG